MSATLCAIGSLVGVTLTGDLRMMTPASTEVLHFVGALESYTSPLKARAKVLKRGIVRMRLEGHGRLGAVCCAKDQFTVQLNPPDDGHYYPVGTITELAPPYAWVLIDHFTY